jgi:hypothetical protein
VASAHNTYATVLCCCVALTAADIASDQLCLPLAMHITILPSGCPCDGHKQIYSQTVRLTPAETCVHSAVANAAIREISALCYGIDASTIRPVVRHVTENGPGSLYLVGRAGPVVSWPG